MKTFCIRVGIITFGIRVGIICDSFIDKTWNLPNKKNDYTISLRTF